MPATREGQAASRSWSGLRGGVDVGGAGAALRSGSGAASRAVLRSGAGPALNLGSGRHGESARRPRGNGGGKSGVDLGDEVAVGKDEPRG